MKPLLLRRSWDAFSARFPRTSLDINYTRRYHRYEKDLWAVPRFCHRNAVSIDVGANQGIYSRWMARHSQEVHSFECNPTLMPQLGRVVPENVVLHGCGLSDAVGTMQLRFDPANTGIGTLERSNLLDQNEGIKDVVSAEVEVKRLDDFELRRVSFVKIDVEGHELSVLKGARRTLADSGPTLLIEIEERHCCGNLERVPAFLADFGYRAYVLEEGNLIAVAVPADAATKGFNNFWFRVK